MAQQAVDTITDHERLAGLHIDAHTLLNTPSVLAADNQVPAIIVQAFRSDNLEFRRIAVDKIRKRLQEYPSAQSIQPVINAGLVPDVVALLESHDGDFQIAAASMVTNIASGSSQQTCSVVEAGAIPSLRRLATAANEELAETAVLALGNITADSAALRDAVEKQGCVETILDILQNDTSADKVRRKALWVIACYLNPGLTPKLSLERAKVALPSIIKSIQETLPTPGNMDALRYAIEALDRICRLDLSRLDLIQTGIVPKLVQLISDSSSSVEVCKHALGCLGYLAWGTDLEAEVAINAGLPAALPAHLVGPNQYLALWNASNIAAGTAEQVQTLLDTRILNPVIGILLDDAAGILSRREACWIVANLTAIGHLPNVREALDDARSAHALCNALLIPDCQTRELAIRGITNMIVWMPSNEADSRESRLEILRRAGGPQNFRRVRDCRDERLQNPAIKKDCRNLLTKHFPEYSRRARV